MGHWLKIMQIYILDINQKCFLWLEVRDMKKEWTDSPIIPHETNQKAKL